MRGASGIRTEGLEASSTLPPTQKKSIPLKVNKGRLSIVRGGREVSNISGGD